MDDPIVQAFGGECKDADTEEKIIVSREVYLAMAKACGYDRESLEWLNSKVVVVKKFQVKHIPTIPILEFLESLDGRWATFLGVDDETYDQCILHSMPPWVNANLARAKMRNLIKRGLVYGCACGCRGDFYLTISGHLLVTGHKSGS